MKVRTVSSREEDDRVVYRKGFKEGYDQGLLAGGRQFGELFDGTSIIVPTSNQLQMLKSCLANIEKHTESPFEIIVVDNASSDGTVQYLESLGGLVRFRNLDSNLGFAGAVNVGLMMSKGRTIALLHSETMVTEKWLRNLLYCLNSAPDIGMIGPVSNFANGEQRLRVPYRQLEDMPAFARKHNHRRPSLWHETERLNGFCLVFRRELFEEIGYFDEGFEWGSFEDNDYCFRVMLAGKRLIVAGDTYVHHFDNESTRDYSPAAQGTNERNEYYFIAKWNDPNGWMQQVRKLMSEQRTSFPAGAALFPQWVAVKGAGLGVYWIENGERHLVEGSLSFPVMRLSQVDLRRWPVGDPIAAGIVERRWRGLDDPDNWTAGVALLPDDTAYHVEGDTVRRIVNHYALHAWKLYLKPTRQVRPEELAVKRLGTPIIPPTLLRQVL